MVLIICVIHLYGEFSDDGQKLLGSDNGTVSIDTENSETVQVDVPET